MTAVTSIFHIAILVGLGVALIAILGWAVYEIVDFVRRIFPYDNCDDEEDLR